MTGISVPKFDSRGVRDLTDGGYGVEQTMLKSFGLSCGASLEYDIGTINWTLHMKPGAESLKWQSVNNNVNTKNSRQITLWRSGRTDGAPMPKPTSAFRVCISKFNSYL